MRGTHSVAWRSLKLGLALWLTSAACDSGSPSEPAADTLRVGTWGGDGAGVIVGDTIAHVHIHCTYGDFRAPISIHDNGQLSVTGSYLLTAYPIARGPTMPAVLTGMLRGTELTMSIVVADTIENRLTFLGPVKVAFGRDPIMSPCPICQMPGDWPALPRVMRAAQDVFHAPRSVKPSTMHLDSDRAVPHGTAHGLSRIVSQLRRVPS